jgi:hypothetical protein
MSTIIPHPNTPQLKVIDAYLTSLATFNLTRLQTLTTDDFHMITAPASMKVPDKTKKEDIAFLEKLKENLGGKHLEVSGAPGDVPLVQNADLSVRQYTVYDVVDGAGKTWVHVSLFNFRELTDLRLISRHSSRQS